MTHEHTAYDTILRGGTVIDPRRAETEGSMSEFSPGESAPSSPRSRPPVQSR